MPRTPLLSHIRIVLPAHTVFCSADLAFGGLLAIHFTSFYTILGDRAQCCEPVRSNSSKPLTEVEPSVVSSCDRTRGSHLLRSSASSTRRASGAFWRVSSVASQTGTTTLSAASPSQNRERQATRELGRWRSHPFRTDQANVLRWT